jgi:hypothetical protein
VSAVQRSALGEGVVNARVDGSHVRLILQVVVRWGEVRVKVIKGNEVLSYEERRSKV